jgi:hypothetical protein
MVERADGGDVAPQLRIEPNVRMAGPPACRKGFEGRVTGSPSSLVLDTADVLDAVREAVDARVERGRRVGCQEPLDFREQNVAHRSSCVRGSRVLATEAASPTIETIQ